MSAMTIAPSTFASPDFLSNAWYAAPFTVTHGTNTAAVARWMLNIGSGAMWMRWLIDEMIHAECNSAECNTDQETAYAVL